MILSNRCNRLSCHAKDVVGPRKTLSNLGFLEECLTTNSVLTGLLVSSKWLTSIVN